MNKRFVIYDNPEEREYLIRAIASATDAVMRNAVREQLKRDFARRVEYRTGEQFELEYPFARGLGRRWRSDIAFPSVRVAVEIDGGLWIYGRHNRASGALADMEKGNGYASLGWVVFHCPWEWIDGGRRDRSAELIEGIAAAIEGRKHEAHD